MTTKVPENSALLQITDNLAFSDPDQNALLEGLSDRQKDIVRCKMRGIRQNTIAKMLDLTPARVSQEMKAIKQHYAHRGSSIDQATLVGETVTLFEEVEQKAWEVFHTDENKKLRALDTIMTAREKQLKLYMDLGILKRAAVEHAHDVYVSPVLKSLTREKKEALVAHIIEISPGDDPEPPYSEDLEQVWRDLPDDPSDEDSTDSKEFDGELVD